MYLVVAAILGIIRNVMLPNPFEVLGVGVDIYRVVLPAFLTNIIMEVFMHPITYWAVGWYYESGDNPVCGSFLYMIWYMVLFAAIWIACFLCRYIGVFSIIAAGVFYFAIHYIFCKIKYD